MKGSYSCKARGTRGRDADADGLGSAESAESDPATDTRMKPNRMPLGIRYLRNFSGVSRQSLYVDVKHSRRAARGGGGSSLTICYRRSAV